MDAKVTVPHGINRRFRKAIVGLGMDGFVNLVGSVLKNIQSAVLIEEPLATPTIRVIQRRYPTQRAIPFIDGEVEFDLRTAFINDGPVKYQPQWLEATYDAFVSKRSNLQIQFGVDFDIVRCPSLRKETALDVISKSWLACKPLVDYELATG